MENASKALLMAGGVLISVLIIGLFTYMFTSMSGVFQTESDIEITQEIEKYNKEYLSYNKKLMRGAEIITLMNKVIDNYEKYDKLDEYRIIVEFTLKKDLAAYKRESYIDINGLERTIVTSYERDSLKSTNSPFLVSKKDDTAYQILFNRDKTDIETFNDFKRRVFDCIGVEYNNFGRISKIKYLERELDDYAEGI